MEQKRNMAYRAFFDYNRQFGIELEGYGYARLEIVEFLEEEKILSFASDFYTKGTEKWIVSTDGTINHSYPVELISPVLQGSSGIEQIRRVCKAMNRLGVHTDKSCGFHIHWHVPDFTGRSVINLLRLYGKYEKILDCFFDQSRRGDTNEHARSLLKGNDDPLAWIYALNKPFHFQAFQIAREFEISQSLENTTSAPSARHHKVNLCAINKYQTIEFRQHQGTFDFDEIYNWIIFSQQLINRAKDSMVGEGIATWATFIRTLALSDAQLELVMPNPDQDLLRNTRKFYIEKYRKNYQDGLYETVRDLQLSD